MKSIVIFGTGNVATHLFSAINKTENFKVIQVYNHNQSSLAPFAEKVEVTTNLADVFPADIYLFALKDDAIAQVAANLNFKEALMAHTSGATPLSVFDAFEKKGVFYPLQTFSKKKAVHFDTIPFCLEAGNEAQYEVLEQLAAGISRNVYRISSTQRKSLHVAAVFVSNFVNHLYTIGEEICEEHTISFDILKPLILETASKITTLRPVEAQTGPAKRKDNKVIKAHLELLNNDQQKLYTILTQSIQQLHGKEL